MPKTKIKKTSTIINKDLSDLKKYPLKPNELLVLRTCNPDMSSFHDSDFIWHEKGFVEASDWVKSKECGNGLHGLPWGVGNHTYLNWYYNAKWIVVRVDKKDGYVEFDDKCKYRRGYVIFSGGRLGATTILVENGACNYGKVVGAVISVGDNEIAITGSIGKSTSGNWGTSTSGYSGMSISGDWGTSATGKFGASTSGNMGISISGDNGISISDVGGTSFSGYFGTSISGHGGTSTSGAGGIVASGDNGIIKIFWYDEKSKRHIPVVGTIGENGLKPNVKYSLNGKYEFEEVTDNNKISNYMHEIISIQDLENK